MTDTSSDEDRIVYIVTSSGEDGRAKTKVEFASFDKAEAKDYYGNLKYSKYYSLGKKIVEVGHETKQALAKLDGVQRLMLGLEQRILLQKDKLPGNLR